MSDRTDGWLLIGLIAFGGGVVNNIIIPARRGVWGFAAAALIGVFCGGVAGIVANGAGWPEWSQWLIAAIVGVMGDRFLSSILRYRLDHQTVNNYGPVGQQNLGQLGGSADGRVDLDE